MNSFFSGNSIKLPKQFGRKNQLGNQFHTWANGSNYINGYEKENEYVPIHNWVDTIEPNYEKKIQFN